MDIESHGGDWTGTLLDFSVNVSPLPVPDSVQTALRSAAASLNRYPDPLCRRLCAKIGEAEGVPAEQVLCGNGASDLIYRTALAVRPRRAVLTAPTFSEYGAALDLSGCGEMIRFPLRAEADFRLDECFLDVLTPGTELVFLCQPNNPTGVTIEKPLLRRILDRCQTLSRGRERSCVLALDECFLGFLDNPGAYTLREALPEYPNLLLLRAFTKLYGLAGVRLGYALCGDAGLLNAMRRCGPPWSVSTLAEAAGLAALDADGYAEAVRDTAARQRPRLYAALGNLGLRVAPGEANFLLFQSPVPLEEPLRARGILIRNCGNFSGLDHTWYRTAVRTGAENRRLIAALEEILTQCDSVK